MRTIPMWICMLLIATAFNGMAQNTVAFYNLSGEPALVRLIGPSAQNVAVPHTAKRSVEAEAGTYYIKVRYGTPGTYSYSRGDPFEVTETETEYSATTITLHKVLDGNYESRPISEVDFW